MIQDVASRSRREIRGGSTSGPRSLLGGEPMTVRERETLLQALDVWRNAVGQMTWETRAEASLALLIVKDDELAALRTRIERGEIN